MFKPASFRQLKTLQTVARRGSISGAADELHLTQPAVSLQVSSLGDLVGAPMLRRVGRDVQLTAAGEIMARYANDILGMWTEAGEEIAALRGELGGTLRIGAITTAEYLIPPLLVRFMQERQGVKLQFKVGNRDEIVRMLVSNEIDVAVMGRQPREIRTVATPFAKHPMAFLASPAHALASHSDIRLEELRDANLLIRERGAGTRVAVEGLFRKSGVKLQGASELSSNEAIKQLVEAGLGVAFLSLHACVLELRAGLLKQLAVLDTPVERAWYVIHMHDRRLPRVAGAFCDFLGSLQQEGSPE
jgi:LysR family transcriptional regulator, low CO2-responsive transcriptional regulator